MKTWIAPLSNRKTKNFLMLDLEQVLFVDSNLLVDADLWKKKDHDFYLDCCQLRNYSKEFVFQINKLFDKVYLNTSVYEETAHKIMTDFFDVSFFYHYSHSNIKSGRYDQFSDEIQLFHLEDNILSHSLVEDANNMKRNNVHIFSIDPYNSHDNSDDSLEKMLIEMKKYLV